MRPAYCSWTPFLLQTVLTGYQKTGFIFSEYQTDLSISDEFIKICKEKSGNSKRYLTNGISEPGYSGEWKLVYPKDIKRMKNGGSFSRICEFVAG